MEDLGFAERGTAWKDVLAGAFDLDGDLPVNPDGGLKSFGHPVGRVGSADDVRGLAAAPGRGAGGAPDRPSPAATAASPSPTTSAATPARWSASSPSSVGSSSGVGERRGVRSPHVRSQWEDGRRHRRRTERGCRDRAAARRAGRDRARERHRRGAGPDHGGADHRGRRRRGDGAVRRHGLRRCVRRDGGDRHRRHPGEQRRQRWCRGHGPRAVPRQRAGGVARRDRRQPLRRPALLARRHQRHVRARVRARDHHLVGRGHHRPAHRRVAVRRGQGRRDRVHAPPGDGERAATV